MKREKTNTDLRTETVRPEKRSPDAGAENIRIRCGCAADDPEIEKILGVYFLDRDDIPAERFVLAECGGKIVGAASYDICEKAADKQTADERNREKFGEIHTIAVLPSFKNKGIGKKLLDALIGRPDLRCGGGHPETIYVRTTAPGFFRHMGFEDCPPDLKKELWDECRLCETYAECAQKTLMLAIE